ncbi:MAG: 30S ribosomal protein S19 [Candidatus Berkelbacteria bacterium]|nr:30S ribosomal protein S19 [Candidatus Berkelbacteria bacterium]
MSRSLKKGPYINEKLIHKLQNFRAGDKTVIKVWDRGATITPEMVGFRFGIHNGKTHIEVLMVEDMVGHKLGEFSPSRKFIRHGGRMAREEATAVAQKEATAVKASQAETDTKVKAGAKEKPGKGGK